jgi:predicted RNA-binding Zn ribbon-like protein
VNGSPAVDLVNTELRERGRPRDVLADEEALAAWLEREGDRLGLASPTLPVGLHELRALRAALREVFAARVGGARPAASALAALNAASARSPTAPELEWRKHGPPSVRPRHVDPLAAVACAAIELLAGPDGYRLRACANPGCVLFFLAANRRRSYCSESCGLRTRVARHRRRQR